MRVVIDTETRSALDVTDVGPNRYFADISTKVLLVPWLLQGSALPLIWQFGEAPPLALFDLLADPAVVKVAANSAFDRHALEWLRKYRGWPAVDPDSWSDVSVRAGYQNLPRRLEYIGPALGLAEAELKSKEGKRLIQLFCRPQKPTKKRPQGGFAEPEERPEEWERFRGYALQDVVTAAAVNRLLPELSDAERMIWRATEAVNDRGVRIDLPLVENAQKLVTLHGAELGQRFTEITGEKVRYAKGVAAWLRDQGIDAPNVQRSTMTDLASQDHNDDVAEAIAIRQDIGAAAVGKLPTMLHKQQDGRLFDEYRYYGASMSGRWAGQGAQLQNLARPRLAKEQIAAMTALLSAGEIEATRWLFERPIDDFGSCMRGLLIASNGEGLEIQDFKSIEFRVLLWMACQPVPIGDAYKEAASKIWNIRIEAVEPWQRQIGKPLVLGSGYCLSPGGFIRMMWVQNGIRIDPALAERCIAVYRKQFPAVPQLWKHLERKFHQALGSSKPVLIIGGKASYERLPNDALGAVVRLNLPSGRPIFYRGIERHPSRCQLPDLVIQAVKNGKLVRDRIHLGHLTEHLVSGHSRDLLARAFVLAEKAGLRTVMLTHDELVVDGDTKGELARIMTSVPKWSAGALVEVEGHSGARRYGK